jgi:hypothetical protein
MPLTLVNRRFAETMLLVAAPPTAFWLMHFVPIAQNGSLDPYVYTGYIHNFVDLFERYGMTYYGVRFGLILPGQLAATVSGDVAGYFALRYVLVLLGGIPFYVLVKQRYGLHAALATYFLWLTSPFLARTVLWDHPDASGVMFLLAAIAFFSIEHGRRRVLDVTAGMCAGMAIHSNIFASAPLSIYLASYVVVWWWRRGSVAHVLGRLLVIAAGVAAVSAFGAAYYWWRIGHADIFTITLETAAGLAGGGMEDYRTPGIAWIARRWWVLTPALVVGPMTLVFVRMRGSFYETVIWMCLTGTTAFYAISQFLLHADFLELFYYFSYTLPIVFLSLASIIGYVWNECDRRTRVVCAMLLLASAAGPWVLRSLGRSVLSSATFAQYIAVLVVTFGLVTAVIFVRRSALPIVSSISLGIVFYFSFAVPGGHYAIMVSDRSGPSSLELDVYRVALELIRSIPALSERAGILRFWYHNGPPESLQSIQSTYLWGFSKIQREDPDRGLPYLGPSERARITEPGVRWLALLADQESQLASARAALVEHGIVGHTVNQRVMTSGGYTAYLDVLEIDRVAPPDATFGSPVIDITDPATLNINVYGSRAGHVTADSDSAVFMPDDERDHLASPFVDISPLVGKTFVRVIVDWPGQTKPSCQLILQNQDFDPLQSFPCASATQYIEIPATTRKMRINLTDPKRLAFVLPRRIEVAVAENARTVGSPK